MRRRPDRDQLELALGRFVSGLPETLLPVAEGASLAPTSLPPIEAWPSYQAYLRSARWAALRAEALDRDNYRCRFCDSAEDISVHHRRYPERWGEETVEDLTTTCRGCHAVLGWFRRRALQRAAERRHRSKGVRMDEAAIEGEIRSKGLTAPRLTPEIVDDLIVGEAYHLFPGTTLTVCALTLRNGYHVVGEAASASPDNFDEELGRKIARSKARDRIWALEGYALRSRLAATA